MQPQKIFTIIVTWNKVELLVQTIEGLLKQENVNNTIVVVDNNSNDNTCGVISQRFPQVVLLKQNMNTGWAKGNNIGIKYSLKKNATSILLCNNDIIIKDKFLLSKLTGHLEEYCDLKVSIVSPLVYSFPKTNEIQFNGNIILSKNKKYLINKNRKSVSVNHSLTGGIFSDTAAGAFMLVESDVFKEIGFIDEDFFMYGEETDFCLRAWRKFIASIAVPDCKVYHIGGASTGGKFNAFVLYYKTRNLLLLLRKHKEYIEAYPLQLYFYFKYLFKIIKQTLLDKKNSYSSRYKLIKAITLGFFHGVRNKTGKVF